MFLQGKNMLIKKIAKSGLLLLLFSAFRIDGAEIAELHIPKTDCPPFLDGVLDDDAWQSSARMSRFSNTVPLPVSAQTETFLCYDNSALYIAFRCFEPNPSEIKMKAGDEQQVWKSGDDLVAIFLQSGIDEGKYYQFATTARGIKLDQVNTVTTHDSGSYNPRWQVQTMITENCWIAEIVIPWEALGAGPEMGRTWRINCCRYKAHNRELTTWAKTMDWDNPAAFGYLKNLIIEKSSCNNFMPGMDLEGLSSLTAELFISNPFEAVLKNTTERPFSGQVLVSVRSPSGKIIQSEHMVDIPAHSCTKINSDYVLTEEGLHEVSLEVRDAESGRSVYLSPPAMINTRKIFDAYLDRNYYTDEQEVRILPIFGFEQKSGKELSLEMELSRDGKVLSSEKISFDRQPKSLPLKIAKLEIGRYQVRIELKNTDGIPVAVKHLQFAKLQNTKGEVKTDQDRNCLLVDGQPFFPIGIFVNKPITEQYAERFFEDIQGSGFNLVLSYERGENMKKFLDMCAACNLRATYDVGHSYYTPAGFGYSLAPNMPADAPEKKKRDEIGDKVRKQIAKDVLRYKDHPALFAWYGIDEPGAAEKDECRKLYQTLKEFDPYHQVWITFCQKIPFLDGYDILNVDRYWDHLEGTPLSVASCVDRLQPTAKAMRKPLTMTLASVWSGGMREITPEQNRAQSYLAVIHGAKGISYFFFRPFNERVWNEEKKLTLELRELSQILLTPDLDNQIVSQNAQNPIHLTAKWHDGKLWIIAVNALDQSVKQTIKIDGLSRSNGMEYFEKRNLSIKDNSVSDIFPAYGSHVYVFQGVKQLNGYVIKTFSELMEKERKAAPLRKAPPFSGAASNLILNSSGEISTFPELPDLWWCYWHQSWDRALLPLVDHSTAVDGYNSLLIRQPKRGTDMAITIPFWYQAKKLRAGETYTFSLYLKAAQNQTPVRLRLGSLNPVNCKDDFVMVGQEWQRFSFTKTCPTDKKTEMRAIVGIAPQSDGAQVWVDAVQCETGTQVTPYTEDEVTRVYWSGI